MQDGSYCNYVMSDFSYAFNVWALEVFFIFRGYSQQKPRKFPRMLCWGLMRQSAYNIIVDKYFHAEHRFMTFVVNVVATDQEMHHFLVALQFPADASSSSSCAIFTHGLIDHLVDEVDDQTLHSQQIGDVNLPIVEATSVDIPVLDKVFCKRRRCDDGKKDDDDLSCWNLIRHEDSMVEKCTSFGIEIYFRVEDLGK
ncbi:hypothetical protein K7X08_003065 [Anisodus acutangulus]|uniref:Uncharacterized protein n=1 Tax=Anisodus acutangulus TaxID=402998 RepID=A0A9Q1MDH0_9SOLA|nr:hypothetical protein K7X08_003065 [Anisodus acutangulus]